MFFRKRKKLYWVLLSGSLLIILIVYYYYSNHRKELMINPDQVMDDIKWHRLHDDASHVCLSVDDKTLVGAVTVMNSIVKNTQFQILFHILITEDAVEHLTKWLSQSELNDIHYEAKIFKTEKVQDIIRVALGRKELAEPMNYARFYYADYFPELHGNIIHLDNDCIVQGDIHNLDQMQFNETKMAAFSDDCISVSNRSSFVDNIYQNFINFKNVNVQALKMNGLTCSFNTGVYVFDVDMWRFYNMTKTTEHWMKLNKKEDIYGNEKGGGGSQPPLMIALYEKYLVLDPLWNVRHLGMTKRMRYSAELIKKVKILHWSGSYKPWETNVPFRNAWIKYFIPDPTGKYKPIKMNVNYAER